MTTQLAIGYLATGRRNSQRPGVSPTSVHVSEHDSISDRPAIPQAVIAWSDEDLQEVSLPVGAGDPAAAIDGPPPFRVLAGQARKAARPGERGCGHDRRAGGDADRTRRRGREGQASSRTPPGRLAIPLRWPRWARSRCRASRFESPASTWWQSRPGPWQRSSRARRSGLRRTENRGLTSPSASIRPRRFRKRGATLFS